MQPKITKFIKICHAADHSQLGDSLDRLMDDNARQFSDASESVEDAVFRKMAEDELHLALGKLTDEEYTLVYVLFFEEKTRVYAKALGVSQVAVHKKKQRILKKLKEIIG